MLCGSDTDKQIAEDILDLVRLYESQGHSGGSGKFCVDTFKRLVEFKPLGVLKGTPDEWLRVDEHTLQNIRCPHVYFDHERNIAFDACAKVFSRDGKNWFTTNESAVEISFPYKVPADPERIIIH